MKRALGERALTGAALFALAWCVASAVVVISGRLGEYPLTQILVGVISLALGMRTAWHCPGTATRLLGWICTGLALAACPAPAFDTPAWNTVLALPRSGLIFAALGASWHLCWLIPWGVRRTPDPEPVAIYLPVFMAWLIVAVRALWLPDSGRVFDTVMLIFIGLLIGAAVVIAAITFCYKMVRGGPAVRREKGLRAMFAGTLLGILPASLAGLTPLGEWPGARFWVVTMLLLPVTWAAVARHIVSAGAQHPDR